MLGIKLSSELEFLERLLTKNKFASGVYASVNWKGLTVSVSKYGGKCKTTLFYALKGEEESYRKFQEEATNFGVSDYQKVFTTIAGEPAYLVKVEKDGLFLSESLLKPYLALKRHLKKETQVLFRKHPKEEELSESEDNLEETTFREKAAGYLEDYAGLDKKGIKTLIEVASYFPIKVIFGLKNNFAYSVEVNSIFNPLSKLDPTKDGRLKVFAGLRKKIYSDGSIPYDDLQFFIPSNAEVENTGNGYYAIVPLIDTPFKDALESLKQSYATTVKKFTSGVDVEF